MVHGLEYPRNKELINFLKNKIKLKQKEFSIQGNY